MVIRLALYLICDQGISLFKMCKTESLQYVRFLFEGNSIIIEKMS